MEHIKKQLDININKTGLRKIAESARVCYVFEEIKKDVLKDINCEVISFKNGVLKIKAGSSAEASEIRLMSSRIKKALERKLKSDYVRRIDAKVTI